MPDYKEMYFKLFRATEQAMNILISAQRECEEMYIGETSNETENESKQKISSAKKI